VKKGYSAIKMEAKKKLSTTPDTQFQKEKSVTEEKYNKI
jgi:hypothetical protein